MPAETCGGRVARSRARERFELLDGLHGGARMRAPDRCFACGKHFIEQIARPLEASPMFLSVSEWAGLRTTLPLDGANADANITPTASAGSITTHARDLVVFGISNTAPATFGTPAPGTWTQMKDASSAETVASSWYREVPTVGAVSVSVAVSAPDWDAAIAAFRVAD